MQTEFKKNIWDSLNNRQNVSVNLLSLSDVYVKELEGKMVIVVRVPRSTRHERPVYTGLNPLEGTYRRNHTGDYKCNRDEVGRMLADQSHEPPDSRILPYLKLKYLDNASIEQYRNCFASRDPSHPWLALPHQDFLERLGAWRKNLISGETGFTIAGILMFGRDEIIRDPDVLPNFHLDYREPDDDPAMRWRDRLMPDGKWTANLFQFFYTCLSRLYRDLKMPFLLEGFTRIEDTEVHIAVREALANALIHADYRGVGGIVITKTKRELILSNPGTMLVSLQQLQKGGVSECRNKSLQLMFQMLGVGEKAGSGIERMRAGWESQRWLPFDIEEAVQPDRILVKMPFVSKMPEESLKRLTDDYGHKVQSLDSLSLEALVIAEIEKKVTNERLQLATSMHPYDISRMLQKLVDQGFLEKQGRKRGAYYILAVNTSDSSNLEPDSSNLEPDSSNLEPNLHFPKVKELEALQKSFYPDGFPRKVPKIIMRQEIIRLCTGRFLTADHVAAILGRNSAGLRNLFITPMVREGLLTPRNKERPNDPAQAYRAVDMR